jgi:hypothetical protein
VSAKPTDLYRDFRPQSYTLSFAKNQQPQQTIAYLDLRGQKIGRPSKRIALHQNGLKINSATITPVSVRDSFVIEVVRINHLPTLEQVRIHTQQMLYPGMYQLKIEYNLPPGRSISQISTPRRKYLPCVDEPKAWDQAKLEIKS